MQSSQRSHVHLGLLPSSGWCVDTHGLGARFGAVDFCSSEKKKRAFSIESRNYTNRLLNDKGERKKQHFTTPHPAKALPVNIELEQHLQQDNDLN